MSQIVYKELNTNDELKDLEYIQKNSWEMPEIEIVPSRLFRASITTGGLVIGAIDNTTNEIVGFSWGWPAYDKSTNRYYFYSHYNSVTKGYQNRGIGYFLKLTQREWAIKNGFDEIRWTFDPLQSRNAYLNIHKLGAICNIYKINYYGERNDAQNKGIQTDRFFCSWQITSENVKTRLQGKYPDPPFISDSKSNEVLETKELENKLYCISSNLSLDNEFLFVKIPANINQLKSIDLDLARKWRNQTRNIFLNYFNKGYTIIDFVSNKQNRDKIAKNFYYILKRDAFSSYFPYHNYSTSVQ